MALFIPADDDCRADDDLIVHAYPSISSAKEGTYPFMLFHCTVEITAKMCHINLTF